MGVQKIAALLDREGNAYFQERAALLAWRAAQADRRASLSRAAGGGEHQRSSAEVEAPLFNSMLHAKLRALPTVDPNDGETGAVLPQLFPSTRREGVPSGYSAVDSSWRR